MVLESNEAGLQSLIQSWHRFMLAQMDYRTRTTTATPSSPGKNSRRGRGPAGKAPSKDDANKKGKEKLSQKAGRGIMSDLLWGSTVVSTQTCLTCQVGPSHVFCCALHLCHRRNNWVVMFAQHYKLGSLLVAASRRSSPANGAILLIRCLVGFLFTVWHCSIVSHRRTQPLCLSFMHRHGTWNPLSWNSTRLLTF